MTFVASPPWITPTFAVPQPDGFSIFPSQPSRCNSAIASEAIVIALTPRSGDTPAWLAVPEMRNGEAIAAGGPDGDLVGRSAVKIEGQLWPAEHADRADSGRRRDRPPPARSRGMSAAHVPVFRSKRTTRPPRSRPCRYGHRRPRAVCLSAGNDVFSLLYGLCAAANRHGIDVGHQQSSRPRPGTGQFEDEIADLPAVRDLAMGLIKTQHFVGRPALRS